MVVLLAVHLVLHWEWLYGMLKRRLTGKASTGAREALRAGVVFVVVLLLAGLGFAMVTAAGVRLREVPLHELGQGDASSRDIGSGATTFARDIWPIFEGACSRCHGPSRERGGFRADRREDYFVGRPGGALVIPGAAEQSGLMLLITGRAEDVKDIEAHRLPDGDVEVVRRWIAAGADW